MFFVYVYILLNSSGNVTHLINRLQGFTILIVFQKGSHLITLYKCGRMCVIFI